MERNVVRKTARRFKARRTPGHVSILAKHVHGHPVQQKGVSEKVKRLAEITGESRVELEAELPEKAGR